MVKFAEKSVLIGKDTAIFYPKDFDSFGNLPSFALIEKPQEIGQTPANWPTKVQFDTAFDKNIAYIAIQFPILNGEFLYQGQLGKEVSTEKGYKAMELCALNVLAQVNDKIEIDRLIGLNHLDAYFRSTNHWDESPKVVNGASDLFQNVLEDKGKHSRAIIGVENLPRHFCVGLSTSFTIDVA